MIKVPSLFDRRRQNGIVLILALIAALAFCITPLVVTTTASQPPQHSSILQTHQVVITTAEAANMVGGQIHGTITAVTATTDQLYSFMQFEAMTMMALTLAAIAILGTTSLTMNRELRRRLRKRGHDLILWSATLWHGTTMRVRYLVERTGSLVTFIWIDMHRQVSRIRIKMLKRHQALDIGTYGETTHGTATSNHSFRPALTLSS